MAEPVSGVCDGYFQASKEIKYIMPFKWYFYIVKIHIILSQNL